MPAYVTVLNAGRVVVWGDDTYGQIDKAPKTHDIVKVVPGGHRQSLGIRSDRSLVLWGGENPPANEPPVPDLPALTGVRFFDAALGLQRVVGILENGKLESYPPGNSPATTPPTGRYIGVASAGGHSIAIREDGKLCPWGDAATAKIPPPEGVFTKVRARSSYVLALRADGCLFAWGGVFESPLDVDSWDGWQQDGAGHWFIEGPFKDMDAGAPQDYVPAGGTATIRIPHVLAIDDLNRVLGWGMNSFGETEAPAVSFQAIAAGKAFSVGLDVDGYLHQWGRSLWPQPVGTTSGLSGRPSRRSIPKGRFISISAGVNHAVALRPSGVQLAVGPDVRDMTTRQPSLETPAVHVTDRELADALGIVRRAVADRSRAGLAGPAEAARRDQQLGEIDRLSSELLEVVT